MITPTTSAPPTCPPNARATRRRLAHEWAELTVRRAAIQHAATWGVTDEPPRSLDDVRVAVGAGDRSTAADQRLRRLVELAAHDDLAARVVIERLVPGLMTLARRRAERDSFEELLAGLWIAIRTFNPERRPSCIAVALLTDADHHAYRRRLRRRSSGERPSGDADGIADRLADERDVDPLTELATLVADARRAGMSDDDLELVRLLVAHPSTEDVAARLDVTSRTVRNRRDRVARRLREVALAT